MDSRFESLELAGNSQWQGYPPQVIAVGHALDARKQATSRSLNEGIAIGTGSPMMLGTGLGVETKRRHR
jgi:hypothetical protein